MGYSEITGRRTDKIKTNLGLSEITSISSAKSFLSNSATSGVDVFDLVNVADMNEYYTNGILSHNCDFQGSSGTLISGAKLKELVYKLPLVENDGLTMYVKPQSNRNYVCTVDVSRGKGLDYHAFQIIDVTEMPYVQVCVYRDNMITPLDYAEIVHRATKSYNNATTLVEINDIGGQVADSLHEDFEVETLLYTESAGRSGKRISTGAGKSVDRGVRTTKSVKAIGCNMLKLMIEANQLIINDFNTIEELSTFSRKANSYEAENGRNDDLVMGLVLFGWLSDQQFFKEFTDINTLSQLRERNDDQMMNDLTPFGFYDDGTELEDDGWETTQPTVGNWMNF